MPNGETGSTDAPETRLVDADGANQEMADLEREIDETITRLIGKQETGDDNGTVRIERDKIQGLVARALAAEKLHAKAARERDEQKELARVDSLTKLPNRRALIETLNARIGESLRYGDPVSVIMIDIDRFKVVNDTYGHNKGDEVLKDLAALLRNCLRYQAGDVVGRYGGEEFICIIPRSNGKAALTAERLRVAVRKLHETDPNNTLNISVSAGVSTFYPQNGQSTEPIGAADLEQKIADVREKLINEADEALYCAKRGDPQKQTKHGRNQVWVLNEEESREPFMLTPEKVAELREKYGKRK